MMGYGPGYGHGYGYSTVMGHAGGLLMFLFGVLVIAGIVLLVMWAMRVSHGHGNTVAQPPQTVAFDDAVAIARRRLASGEITKEQYDEIMRVLGG